MQISRPCTACGKPNALADLACGSCGAVLTVASSPTPASQLRRASVPAAPVLRVVAGLVLVGVAVAWWVLSRPRVEQPAAELADWARPETVAAWAHERLASDGLGECAVLARLDGTGASSRRLLEITCTGDVDEPKILEALARLLVLAREGGERTATQAVVAQMAGRVILLPIGEAARIANDLEAAAAWLRPTATTAPEPEAVVAGMPPPPVLTPMAPVDVAPVVPVPAAQDAGAADVPSDEPSPEPPAAALAPAPAPASASAALPAAPAPAAGSAPAAASRGTGVRIARSPGRPTSGPLRAGQSGATLLRVQLSTSVRRALTLESITFKAGGTLQDSEALTAVRLVRESDPTGRQPGQGEPMPSTASFAADDGTVRFDGLGEVFGEDGTPISIAVIADINATARGGSIELVVPEGSGVAVVDGDGESVRVDGVPLRGARAWVAGAYVPRRGDDAAGGDEPPPRDLPPEPAEER